MLFHTVIVTPIHFQAGICSFLITLVDKYLGHSHVCLLCLLRNKLGPPHCHIFLKRMDSLLYCIQLYRLIPAFRCCPPCTKSNLFIFSPQKKINVWTVFHSLSFSHVGCLCLFLLKRLFTLHILLSSALICSTFQVFHPTVSSPSPSCQSTILLSHFPQPRQWARLP